MSARNRSAGRAPGADYFNAFGRLASQPLQSTSADPITEAQSRGIGTHRLPCPQCDKSPRDTALSVSVEADSAVWFCHRCGFKGTTKQRSPQALKAAARREKTAEVWREGCRNVLTGATPNRWPPFTRELMHTGEAWITTGGNAWSAAKRLCGRAVCLPPGHPPQAYRWPVAGRRVVIFDTDYTDGITFGAGRYHARDCPVCHTELVHEWARAFALLLIQRWGAAKVEVVAGGRMARYRREVRHAA